MWKLANNVDNVVNIKCLFVVVAFCCLMWIGTWVGCGRLWWVNGCKCLWMIGALIWKHVNWSWLYMRSMCIWIRPNQWWFVEVVSFNWFLPHNNHSTNCLLCAGNCQSPPIIPWSTQLHNNKRKNSNWQNIQR